MNANAIETLAISAVKNSIVSSEYLDQYISERDKEPSWDGNIYIYKDASRKKEKLEGRVPVQVKGKECDDFSGEIISYVMETSDLINYLYDGGVVLFVVHVNKKCQTKIYYIVLTPIKLRIFLKDIGDQKTKTFKLNEFPSDNNKKAIIFINCLKECRKQRSFVSNKLYSLNELKSQGVLDGISVSISSSCGDGLADTIFNSEVYVYADIKGTNIQQPIELFPGYIKTLGAKNRCNISAGEKVFYRECRIEENKDAIKYFIGEGLTITCYKNADKYDFNFTCSKWLRNRVTDLDFMLQCIDNSGFSIDTEYISIDFTNSESSNFDINYQRKILVYIKKIVKALDMLGYEGDIDMEALSEIDKRNLGILVTAFIDKQPISGIVNELPPISRLTIEDASFILLFNKLKPGMYKILDFCKSEIKVTYEDKNGMELPISQYYLLSEDDLLSLSNLRLDAILPSFQSVELHHETYCRAVDFYLRLLTAYDNSKDTRKDILRTANEFIKWVAEISDGNNYFVDKINYLQLVKRERKFNIMEMTELYSMIENPDVEEMFKTAAYILLENQVLALKHFSKLNDQEKEIFKDFPIYKRFWKKENN